MLFEMSYKRNLRNKEVIKNVKEIKYLALLLKFHTKDQASTKILMINKYNVLPYSNIDKKGLEI